MSNYDDASPQIVAFTLGGMAFEYDEEKNQKNIAKHGISFRNAARVFFDYDRIEFYDEEHSENEDRYDTIGDIEEGKLFENEQTDRENIIVGNVNQFIGKVNDILFVVYTERMRKEADGRENDVIRLISARMATNFERGCTMVNTVDLTKEQAEELAFTEKELEELERARNMPITFDEDCPETTPEKAVKFRRVNPPRQQQKNLA